MLLKDSAEVFTYKHALWLKPNDYRL